MNYLAHLFLADGDDDSLLGALMGDFVKGPIGPGFPPQMRRAIQQHRQIDSFTDQHPVVRASKQRISPRFRRYAPILIDMFYDHFLALHWAQYTEQSLPDFSARVYRLLQDRQYDLPDNMRRPMHYLAHYDLLGSYQTRDGIARALRGIESRLSRPSELGAAIDELDTNFTALAEDFRGFFPDLMNMARPGE